MSNRNSNNYHSNHNSWGCKRKVKQQRWLGVAPFCQQDASDCSMLQPQGDWKYVRDDKSGDGPPCWSGHKILCERTKCVDKNPEYNDAITSWWVGTPPFCAGSPCDCVNQYGAVPWRQDRIGEDPHTPCWTGEKQLCLRPVNPDPELDNWTVKAREVCQHNKEMDYKLIQEGGQILEKIIDKIPTK